MDYARDPNALRAERAREYADTWHKAYKETLARAEAAEAALARVEAALDRHPACGQYPDNDGPTCGWKHAVADITNALRGHQ